MENRHRLLLWVVPVLLLPLLVGLMLAYLPNHAAASAQSSRYYPPKNTGGAITYGISFFPPSTNPWFNSTTEGVEVQDALWGSRCRSTAKASTSPINSSKCPPCRTAMLAPMV